MRIIKSNFFTKEKIQATILFYLYFVITLYNGAYVIFPRYTYAGFVSHIDYFNLFISAIYLLLVAWGAVRSNRNSVKFILSLLALTTIIPMLVFYSINEENHDANLFMFMYVCCYLVLSYLSNIIFDFKKRRIGVKLEKVLLILLFSITILDIVRYIKLNGLGIFNLDIMKVYDYRLQLRETMGGVLAYLDNWVMKIFNPFCIVYSLYSRKRVLIVLFLTLQVLLFGFSSHKSVLFAGFVIVLTYFLVPYFMRSPFNLIKCFIGGTVSLIIVSASEIENNFTIILYSLYRRIFCVPAQINFRYYDFFSEHGFDWFHQSFLRHFFVSKFDMRLPFMIGAEYYGNPETSANTGFLASGYAQGGFIVMLMYSVIVGLMIAFIASLARNLSERFALAFSILPLFFLFTSSDLPSSFVTGGIGWMIILMYILQKEK